MGIHQRERALANRGHPCGETCRHLVCISRGIANRAEGHVRLAREPVEHDLGENHQRGRE